MQHAHAVGINAEERLEGSVVFEQYVCATYNTAILTAHDGSTFTYMYRYSHECNVACRKV